MAKFTLEQLTEALGRKFTTADGKTSLKLSERTVKETLAPIFKIAGEETGLEEFVNDVAFPIVDSANRNYIKDTTDFAKNYKPTTTPPPASDPTTDDELAKIRSEQDARISALEERLRASEKKSSDARILEEVKKLIRTDKYGCSNDAVVEIAMNGCTVNEGDTVETISDRIKKDYDGLYSRLYAGGVAPKAGNSTPKTEFDGKAEVERLRAAGLLPPKAQ